MKRTISVKKRTSGDIGGATLALVVAVVTLLTVLIGCAQHEGASTPQGLRRNLREFVLFCDLAKGHCPTKKEALGAAVAGAADVWTLRALVSEALSVKSTSVGQ